MLSIVRCSVALAATATLAAGAAWADPAPSAPAATTFGVSELALPVSDPAGTLTPEIDAVAWAPAPPRHPGYGSVRYRPRRYPNEDPPPSHSNQSNSNSVATPFQIHAGFFQPDQNENSTSFVLGLRGGPLMSHIQAGVGLDWMHNAQKNVTVSGTPYEQGGVIVTPQTVLSQASADVLPLMGFLQVNLTDGPLVPYVGVGGGWQWLFLNAQDYATGLDYNATFGGLHWQAWGGAQMALSGQARLFGEAYLHQGEASREVVDPAGTSYDEVVNLDGVGMRFGLSWGF